jgi:hypothetical protein
MVQRCPRSLPTMVTAGDRGQWPPSSAAGPSRAPLTGALPLPGARSRVVSDLAAAARRSAAGRRLSSHAAPAGLAGTASPRLRGGRAAWPRGRLAGRASRAPRTGRRPGAGLLRRGRARPGHSWQAQLASSWTVRRRHPACRTPSRWMIAAISSALTPWKGRCSSAGRRGRERGRASLWRQGRPHQLDLFTARTLRAGDGRQVHPSLRDAPVRVARKAAATSAAAMLTERAVRSGRWGLWGEGGAPRRAVAVAPCGLARAVPGGS